MSKKTVIGLAGKAGTGKTTVADILVRDHGFVKMSFGSALKDEAAETYGFDRGLCNTQEGKTALVSNCGVSPELWPWWSTSVPVRTILQWYGTDYRRKQDKNYWVNTLKAAVLESDASRIVIDDVRFENEVAVVQETCGGGVCHIAPYEGWRPSFAHDHASEQLGPDVCCWGETPRRGCPEDVASYLIDVLSFGSVGHPNCKIYIAGPMSGCDKYNFNAFYDAEAALQGSGDWGHVVNPARLDCTLEGWDTYPPEGFKVTMEDRRTFIRRDLEVLLSFKPERGDAIYMLPGWSSSKGACVESSLAIFLGLDILGACG